jgi:hypothetical protein
MPNDIIQLLITQLCQHASYLAHIQKCNKNQDRFRYSLENVTQKPKKIESAKIPSKLSRQKKRLPPQQHIKRN